MSTIYVANHITLDGVMQSPGRPDEDTRDGFSLGGWATAGSNDEVTAALGRRATDAGGMRLLLGHRSYDEMLSHWNTVGGPFKDGLNGAQKFVVSRSASTTLPWPNSTLVSGGAPAIADLRAQDGPDLCVMGSGVLIRTLLEHRLVDELLLFIHPLVLGAGRRLFPDAGAATEWELVSSSAASTGVLIGHYRPAPPR
ncbi:dihydrofolate reductase family protein [Galbitalea sp. SE-J8]|uniref:dihydrofolate reductase family protein n=1 Tax=Galbitalea sp. SE-J8 TaxID=3054952 RepID=UPI00259CFEB0|nr:dihydrofolate reductase family protein [Galbitalea sp. SE-J8]MDM4762821.1 dihydrofolate reductase family protein [Galbitalea sp. SE-J8]